MQNLKVWLSIATSTGLSVVSLGTPGLKEDLDEQVFTGGISAVTHLLSTEIGSSENSFIGGGDTRKMGRFVIKNPSDKSREVVTQFLIMTTDDSKVEDIHLGYIKDVAIEFAKMMIISPIWNEVETGFKTLSSMDVFENFISAITSTRKKHKIQLNDDLFATYINNLISHTFKSPEYFDSLQSISEMEPSFDDIQNLDIKSKLNELFNELLEIMLDEDPIPILFKSKPNDNLNEIKNLFEIYVRNHVKNITKLDLVHIMNEIFSEDIADILQNFNVLELRELRQKIHSTLSNAVIRRISKKNPLLLLVNPSLNSPLASSFMVYINENIEEIYQEYDVASILGKISSLLLEGEDPISILLISDYIRMFAMRFPQGLSNHAWKFIHTSFKMFSKMKNTNIKESLEKLEISPSHLTTINSFLKSIKPSNDLKSIRFTISKEGEEIVNFYNILQQVIIEGTQNFFNEIIWTPKQLGMFSQIYAEKIESVVSQSQYLTSLIAMLKSICTNNSFEYIITKDYIPTIEDLSKFSPPKDIEGFDIDNLTNQQRRYFWKPKNIIKSYEIFSKNELEKAVNQYSSIIEDILKSCNDNLTRLEGNKSSKKSVPKLVLLEKDTFRSFPFLDNYYKEIWKNFISFNEITTKIAEESNVDPKRLIKWKEELNKINDKLIKKSNEFKKRILENQQKYEKNVEKEINKAHKELQKVFSNSKISEYVIKEHKSRETFIIPDPKSVGSLITSSIENSQIMDTNIPKNNELILTFASIVIFNQLPRNIFNDILNTTILFGSKGSPIINDMVSEMKLKISPSVDYLSIEDYLKKKIRNHSEKRIKIIFESILNKINLSYFNGVVRSYPVNSKDYGEISCIDVGDLNIPWMIEKIKSNKKILNLFGKNVHFREMEEGQNKYHVFYEFERFPSSGQRFPITKAIMQGTWNDIIGDQTGIYIEILKMSCDLLGESRRRKFQEFLEKLFQFID